MSFEEYMRAFLLDVLSEHEARRPKVPEPVRALPAGPGKGRVSVGEAARRMGVTSDTIRGLIARGVLPALRVGRVWRIDPEQLEQQLTGEGAGTQCTQPADLEAKAREIAGRALFRHRR
jgi:excisionase family DNA binding protein